MCITTCYDPGAKGDVVGGILYQTVMLRWWLISGWTCDGLSFEGQALRAGNWGCFCNACNSWRVFVNCPWPVQLDIWPKVLLFCGFQWEIITSFYTDNTLHSPGWQKSRTGTARERVVLSEVCVPSVCVSVCSRILLSKVCWKMPTSSLENHSLLLNKRRYG